MTYESKPFNLSSLCHETINSLRPLAKEKDLSIDFDEHYLINQIRIGDEQKIHQVLTNLLGNAIKFTDQGEVNLIVDEHHDEKHGDWVCFVVKDTGMGISEEKQKALFDPFYQVDESNTRKHGGTGLGLAISKKFVEGLGGKIEVESTFGAGSKFQFKLTMKYEINNNNEKPKILIVDDDDVNRTVAKRCLAELCTEIDEAKDGKEGLSMFYNNRYDLILMDVQMPVMDGFEACREIRQHEKKLGLTQTPIIALSASVLGGVKEECIESGMNHYISKPFKKASLISEIKTVIS